MAKGVAWINAMRAVMLVTVMHRNRVIVRDFYLVPSLMRGLEGRLESKFFVKSPQ
jgi:hypothetical protein